MTDPLGLSIGTTNLVAARVGDPPLIRRSVLPTPGQVLDGFVERVGDPVPLVADDGTSYRADQLLVQALDAMVEAASETSQADPSAELAVAVPAHWKGATLRALRNAMRASPRLAPNGTPARLVSDAVAALTALGADPGLPARGVVALLDFGGGGTSITLADAASSFEPIETTRLTEFAGEQVDQVLLAHVLAGIASDADPAGTAAVGLLTQLREECRRAKEALSESTVADVQVDLPGHRSVVQITRGELDELLAEPLAAVLTELDECLSRNRIALADVSAVVAVGGGASIPLISHRLSDADRPTFVTSPQPALDAAQGAALFAAQGADADAQTGVAPTPLIPDPNAGARADGPASATFRALAWSEDDERGAGPTPYTGGESYSAPYGDPYEYTDGYGAETGVTRAVAQYHPKERYDEPRSWQRLPGLIVGAAAVIALVAVGGVAIALTSATDETRPAPATAPKVAPSVPPTVPTTVPPTVPPTLPPMSAAPPPPPVTEAPPPTIVTITSEPPPPPRETVTVERPVTTTVTTTQPTTTTTTQTTPPTTTTTTTTTTTSSTPTMTTSYITVPFVPVPIPIQVPATATANPNQPAYPQQPAYQEPQYQQQPQLPY